MVTLESVSNWIRELKQGDGLAAQHLWRRYFHRLVHLARRRLSSTPRRIADEEDVAQIAFHNFCLGVRAGRYPNLANRDNLWRLLVVLTVRTALDQIKYQRRKCRAAEGYSHTSIAACNGGSSATMSWALENVASLEPTPQFAAVLAEEFRQRFKSLRSQIQREVAWRKLEGYTNAEIAARLGRSIRDVERQLQAIRRAWAREFDRC